MVSSARAIKAGDTFSVKDIKVRHRNKYHIMSGGPYQLDCLSDAIGQCLMSFPFVCVDVQSVGKQLNRDIRREEVMKKKTRVEEKLAELQASMQTDE